MLACAHLLIFTQIVTVKLQANATGEEIPLCVQTSSFFEVEKNMLEFSRNVIYLLILCTVGTLIFTVLRTLAIRHGGRKEYEIQWVQFNINTTWKNILISGTGWNI